MTRLLIKSGREQGLFLELKAGLNRLGRSKDNDLTIDDPTVSATHCEIDVRNGLVSIRDLDSTNGTLVNGQRVKESPIEPGKDFKVGEVILNLETTPVVIAIPEVNFAEPGPPPLLADGSQPCLNHAEVRASHQCSQCQRYFCHDCLHKLRLSGGQLHIFCPFCSGQCELLPGQAPLKRKKSLFARLRDTLKISRR